MQSFNQAYRMAKNVLPSVVVFLNDRLTIVTTSPSWIRWFVNGKKASLESHEINTAILNWYPSHTEIFSKRRKICALWAKDLSMIFQSPESEKHPCNNCQKTLSETQGWSYFQRVSWKWPLFWEMAWHPKRLVQLLLSKSKLLFPWTATCKPKLKVISTVLPSVIGQDDHL